MQDTEIKDIIFQAAFHGLVSFVKSGQLDKGDWEGAEANIAEFELNQCYIWYTKVRPAQFREINSIEKWEEFEADDQKHLERLIKVRNWLR
jgi:hypothetical protein